MKEKINIAEILRDKPINTKLYSPLFGDVYFSHVKDSIINVKHHAGESKFLNSGRYYNYDESEPLLFPSKSMRDWSKFAWKKGDILVSKHGTTEVVFDCFDDDTYETFKGKHALKTIEGEAEYKGESDDGYDFYTENYYLESVNAAQTYINTIEERLGGKLNLETLEIEKAQHEFKDGDIVFVKCEDDKGADYIVICRSITSCRIKDYCSLNLDNNYLDCIGVYCIDLEFYSLRQTTDSEKQQLFDALAKKNKAWDAEKKQIVDLKSKWTPKPFDKVLVRANGYDPWQVSLFGYKDGNCYYCCCGFGWSQCIPYIGNESLLGTTKDMED